MSARRGEWPERASCLLLLAAAAIALAGATRELDHTASALAARERHVRHLERRVALAGREPLAAAEVEALLAPRAAAATEPTR